MKAKIIRTAQAHTKPMNTEVITQIDRLVDIELAWDELYRRDPHAHVYLSSKFLTAVALRVPERFRIVAVWDKDGKCIGLLPLIISTRWDKKSNSMHNVLDMLGHVFDSDYTGILCDPPQEAEVCTALAGAVQAMDFGRLILNYFNGPASRLDAFTEAFDQKIFTRHDTEHRINDGETDNMICPYIDLPDSFDAYLSILSANMRQKLRRLQRQLDTDSSLRITRSRPETYPQDVTILSKLWYEQYAPRKGQKRANHLANLFKDAVMLGLASGMVHLAILWRDGKPIAAQANYIDDVKKQALFHVGARDESVTDLSAGLMLQSHCIRWAIAQGLKRYDFTIGDEAYKYSFGATNHHIRSAELNTISGGNHTGHLDAACRTEITKHIGSFVVRGHNNEARIVAEQAIRTWPDLAPSGDIDTLIKQLGAQATARPRKAGK